MRCRRRDRRRSCLRAWRFGAVSIFIVCGCVIPVAPEFENPEVNYPPYVVYSDPAEGTVMAQQNVEIRVRLGDPNLGDSLFIRWIFDYPKYDEILTRLVLVNPLPTAEGGAIEREEISFTPSCILHNIARGVSQHQLTLSVADREFVKPEQADPDYRLDTVATGGYRVRVSWRLDMECR